MTRRRRPKRRRAVARASKAASLGPAGSRGQRRWSAFLLTGIGLLVILSLTISYFASSTLGGQAISP